MTKRVLYFLVVLLALGATNAAAYSLNTHVLLIAPDAMIQQAPLDRFPNTPAGKAACMAALASGNFKYYVPSFLTDRRKPRAGETVRPLEADACVGLKIAGGLKMAVPQKKGTPYIFGAKGECAVREDCGNDCDWVEYYVPTPVAVETPRQPAPTTSAVRIEIPRDPEPEPRQPERIVEREVPVTVEPEQPTRREFREPSKMSVTAGVEYVFGKMLSEYTDPIPDRGDVPQRHNFTDLVPFVRFDQGERSGFFAYAAMSALGGTSTMEFQDLRGTWNDKNRTSDDSEDKVTRIRAGYKFGWNGMSVGPYVGYSKWCLSCEEYSAQGANTITERSFAGIVLGAEISGKVGDRVTITGLGEYGPSLNRKSWTRQTFGAINFPEVNHPNEKAKTFNLRASLEAKIVGPLHATGAYEYLGISSMRPENYAAKEKTSVNAFSIGVVAKFGW